MISREAKSSEPIRKALYQARESPDSFDKLPIRCFEWTPAQLPRFDLSRDKFSVRVLDDNVLMIFAVDRLGATAGDQHPKTLDRGVGMLITKTQLDVVAWVRRVECVPRAIFRELRSLILAAGQAVVHLVANTRQFTSFRGSTSLEEQNLAHSSARSLCAGRRSEGK
jgi:hypothetical protein